MAPVAPSLRLRSLGLRALRVGWRLARAAAVVTVLALLAWPFVRPHLVDRADFARTRDSLQIVDREGRALRLTRPEGEDRRWVELDTLPPHVAQAFLAIEDARFHEHSGVDVPSLARALLTWALPNRRLSGASTITQQTVKLVHGRPHGLWDKPLEILRALALEEELSKEAILESYLNRVPFGDRIVGVGRASEAYFGKPARELTVSEAALLAGIPQAPSATEPRRHRERAMRRRATVLARMRANGFIDQRTHDAALRTEPAIVDAPVRPWFAPRFVDRVLDAHRRGAVRAEGGTLGTSLDLALQEETRSALGDTVRRFQARGVTNGAALVLDPRSGEVLAYVGAALSDGPGGALDLLQAPRQPGSSLKPFVYELLFERGGSPATVLDDIARPMVGGDGAVFEAEDYDGRERGPVRARVALASSLNLAAIDAARRVGPERVVERLSALGFRGLGPAREYGAAIALGGPDVRPVDLAGAYATLVRGGSPVALRFTKGHGEPGAPVMDPTAAALTVDVLRDGRARAEAFGADLEDLAAGPFALKTGTSSGWHDAWATAADEAHVVVVWLGDPRGQALDQVAGFEAAAPVAARILGAARARSGDAHGEPGAIAGSVTEWVCPLSGARPGPGCGAPVPEHFAEGHGPASVCPFHDASGQTHLPPRYGPWLARVGRAGTDVRAPESRAPLRVAFPRDGDELLVEAHAPPRWTLRARRGDHGVPATFEVDGEPVGASWQVSPGEHLLVALADGERSPPVRVRVESLPSP